MLKILPRISIVQQSRNLSKIYKAVEEALADRKDPILNNREGSTGYTIFETEKFHNSDLLAEYLDFNYGSKFREYIQIKVTCFISIHFTNLFMVETSHK